MKAYNCESATGGASVDDAFLDRYEPSDAQLDEPTGAGILNPIGLMSRRTIGHSYPVWRIHYSGRPISLHVRKDVDSWIAENKDLNILGVGQSPMEAMSDAEQHIRYFAEYYAAQRDDTLTAYSREVKQRFSQISLTA